MSAPLYDRSDICRTYFFPQVGSPLPRTRDAGPVDLHLGDGARISAWLSRPIPGAPVLLYLHGNGECISDQLDRWPDWAREAGANLLLVDYPGYGQSEGEPTFSSLRETAGAALAHLLRSSEREVPVVVVAGRSVGSIFALDAASRTSSPRVRGLLLESAVADVMRRLDLRVPYEDRGIDRGALRRDVERDFDHRRKMARIRGPVLVLHARHDDLVPCWNGERLAEWAGDRLHRRVLFDRGDHNSIQSVNEAAYRAELTDFVRRATARGGDDDDPLLDRRRNPS
jgi:pimeloyl-ACP methyl ester carboxylesterase